MLTIERFGLGAHLAALERLKQKLAAEGLFAPTRKRPLPRFPRLIGLVTGNDAAAKRDVLTAHRAALPAGATSLVAETYVQGPRAPVGDRDRDRRPLPARRRRDRARARRRQLRGSAAVLRRARRARGRRLHRPGRLGRRPRAGHAALRPRRRRARVDADRTRRASSCPTSRELRAHARAVARRPCTAARTARAERHAQRLASTHERLRRAPLLALERKRARLDTLHARARRALAGRRRSSAATRSSAAATTSSGRPPRSSRETRSSIRVADGTFGATAE